MYACECKGGYKGVNCEEIFNPCELKPCKHNTKCIDLMNGDYKCDCDRSGYIGRNCDIDVNDCISSQCTNNSTCIDGINSYKCQCKFGYTGQFCEIPLNPCISLPCMNNSTCKSTGFLYSCECNYGYTGRNCDIKLKPCEKLPCGLHGTCVEIDDTYKCICNSGYTGNNCLQNLNECENNHNICENNSTCIDLDPSTNKRKLGYICDCSTISKQQQLKYGGQNCSIKLDICSTNDNYCSNNSTCVSYLNDHNQQQDFYCRCKPGFAGKYCELNTLITLDSKYYLDYQLTNENKNLIKSNDGLENINDLIISLLNENKESTNIDDYLKIKFDFKLNLYKHRNYESPLCSVKLQNNITIELKINKNFIEIYLNSQLNEMNLPFLNDSNWHSIEIFFKLNFIQIIYKIRGYIFNKKFSFKPTTSKLIGNNNLQLTSFIIGKYLIDDGNLMEACIRDLKLNDNYLFLNDSNIQYGCIKSTPDCSSTLIKSPFVIPQQDNNIDCNNNAVCVNKLFDNECINCIEPYYGKNCEYKSNNIRFDQSRMSNLTIKLENGITNRPTSNGFDISFNFKANLNLIKSTDKNEKNFFFEPLSNELDNEISFLYLLNSQTNELLKISLSLVDTKSKFIGEDIEDDEVAYLNLYSRNSQNNLLIMKNFIKKTLINNKFYKLNIQLKENLIIVKINELSLIVNIDFKYNKTNFDTIIISNKFYGLINSIKINKNIINYNQKLNEEKQVFKLLNSNEYAIVEQQKCLFEK